LRKAVHSWVENLCEGRAKVAGDTWNGAEVPETAAK
jgi:hypothetical protein